ncbi:putative toxin-antitoxin system toxin component, PIN family (plasmid) [Cyanobacterium sp. IPPAS B-1200]|uniref:putative toxin-antitoxin system toxin component, PIN family n=1 Tax=Cyanobacterium sp. IPPAS B-1200 TaxID=1562720 RepID=UPI0008526ABD|nr:putative toxin-antitoxin system toxin component, PIN family [Cyanobacterium sp. IPPAS B-1200]OEJ78540.1 putative toxin-antitoxin system toxin component, PIN family [Cyanobacterium sp. IPPAS B-1200]
MINSSIRLVLDTNILISSILSPNSIPAQVLNWGENTGIILYSTDTLMELLSVLSRKKFAKYIEPKEINELSERIKINWHCVPIIQRVNLCRDEKDNKFIDLALNGRASHLITGDNDLLVLNPIQDISILKPRNFWDLVNDSH